MRRECKQKAGCGVKEYWKPVLSAFYLILPHVLILSLDPAAWRSKYNLAASFAGTFLFMNLPTCLCLFHWFRPDWFKSKKTGHLSLLKCLCWTVVFSGLCWGLLMAALWISIQLHRGPDNGMATVCLLVLGWAYFPVLMIPVGTVYILLRLCGKWLHRCRMKIHRK